MLPDCLTAEGNCNLLPMAYPEAGCAPTVGDGEIKYLYIGDEDFANGLTAEFVTKVTNAGGNGTITKIAVIGTLSEPEQSETVAEGGVTIYGTRTYTVEFEKYEDSQVAYEAMRKLQCDKPVKVWFGNDEYIWGAAADWKTGISTVIRMNHVMEGLDTNAKYTGSFSWKSKYAPDRTPNPDPDTGANIS